MNNHVLTIPSILYIPIVYCLFRASYMVDLDRPWIMYNFFRVVG